jgi:TPR repeat protein
MSRLPPLALGLLLTLAACASSRPPVVPPVAPAPAQATPPPAATPARGTIAPAPGALTAGEIAVEAYFAPVVEACARGDAAACGRLALRLHFTTNNRETRRDAEALAKGCAAHVPIACAGAAITIARGDGAPRDTPRGLTLLQTACDAGQGLACGELAEIEITSAVGVTGKQAEGQQLAATACAKYGGWPCQTATNGLDPDKDAARVLELSRRACDGGDLWACYTLGAKYAEGLYGATVDPARATSYYGKACGDLAPACFNLAWQYLRGTGAPLDEARGRTLLERACTLGDASGCDELARRDGKAWAYCEMWGARACYDVAVEITQSRGETAESAGDLIWAGDHACRRGFDGACRVTRHLRKDSERRCNAGDDVRNTCTFVGLFDALLASDSNPDAQERAASKIEAADVLKRACDAGAKPACDARARLAP